MTATVCSGSASCRTRRVCGRIKQRAIKKELAGQTGSFVCVPPGEGNHGPVVIRNKYHFAYSDGTPFYVFGTTSYQWIFESEQLQAQTLKTLSTSPFNKIRFLLLPPYTEDYITGPRTIREYPFEGEPKTNWDFSRFKHGIL